MRIIHAVEKMFVQRIVRGISFVLVQLDLCRGISASVSI